MRLLPAGDAALLVELPDLAHTLALYRALQARPVAGVRELIPAARTLLLHFERGATSSAELACALRERAAEIRVGEGGAPPARTVEIPVHYRGEDLAEVAQMMGISERQVVERHVGQPWQAAFAGFAPGFVYLAGGHPSFQLPRRKTPRTKVPAGSVALAGDFSAVYPAASPGGWQLIGVTGLVMWDLARAEPALVQPGFAVRFVDADAPGRRTSLSRGPATPPVVARELESSQVAAFDREASAAITIEAPGLQTLLQDDGRRGFAGLGVSTAGALDPPAMRQANRLVGNPVRTPVLENLLGGLMLRSHGRVTLAVTGASVALTLQAGDGRRWAVASHRAVALDDGDRLLLGAPTAGLRCYVAVRGGWDVALTLGSASHDTLAHLGTPALQAGQRLTVSHAVAIEALQAIPTPDMQPPELPRPGDEVELDVRLGPRTDWFTTEALALLQAQHWRVTPQSDRVGVRLVAERPLARSRHDELPSEGTVTGAIQVPASGQPVLFLADHPLTGGYPVIAVLASHHLALAAQLPVGCSVRFRVVAPFEPQNLRA